jgi:hypothetical protein
MSNSPHFCWIQIHLVLDIYLTFTLKINTDSILLFLLDTDSDNSNFQTSESILNPQNDGAYRFR